MALKFKSTKGGTGEAFEIPDADTYQATLVAIIDLGWHETSFKGEDKGLKRKVALVWELAGTKKADGTPFVFAKEYGCSFTEKSHLRIDLETWRRKKYEEGEDIDLSRFVGTPWAIDIAHEPSKKDKEKVYANIAKVGPLPKGTKLPAPTYTPFFFDTEAGKPLDDLPWLPRLFGRKIADDVALGMNNAPRDRNGESDGDDSGPDGDIPF